MKQLLHPSRKWLFGGGAAALLVVAVVATTYSQAQKGGLVSPSNPYDKVFEGYTKVVSTTDGKAPMYEIWTDKKKGGMLAKLPSGLETKKYFFALTVAGGEKYAGLQMDDMYVQWKRYGDRLALIEPNLDIRSSGDAESKSSVNRLFTGKVIVDVPILATSPGGDPVIDMTELLVKFAPKFFPIKVQDMGQMFRLKEIKTAKAFPHNVELAFEIPVGTGQLKTFHYSISELPENTGYKPRKADDRVGYFTTSYLDLGKFKAGESKVRYINRWHLEKADPSLKLSPPKQPIVFYIEHTTPIRYRRFVKDGILYWNKAFEKIGIINAVEVYQQDATTSANMEKDPEDVRYNFIRWLNNNAGTAIGPSRVHPFTGQILDADIILTDGWIRHFEKQWSELLPQFAMQNFGPETMAWLEQHPTWDPRYLLATTQQKQQLKADKMKKQLHSLGLSSLQNLKAPLAVEDEEAELQQLAQNNPQGKGVCQAVAAKSFDMTLLRMTLDMMADDVKGGKDDKDAKKDTEDEEMIDGIPTKFVGPLLADLVAHEVGHTLGLRHNFKGSSIYSLKDINSDKIKGKKPFASSVMDYIPVNIDMKDGQLQGDYAMIDIGPYDLWAIEFGYTLEDKSLPKILARSTEPELVYGTDQDTGGPDPSCQRYDFSSNPLDYAKNQMKLAKYHRERLLEKFVKDGESWSKARKGYEMSLGLQMKSLGMMASWVGGTFINRDHKGDKNARQPVEPVPVAKQRAALKWVLENSFRDESFGLTPKLLQKMKNDHFVADESFSFFHDSPNFPIHDRIMGIQGSVLTMLMNPSTLKQVYDNELIVDADVDTVTLPELLNTIQEEIFAELKVTPSGKFTDRKPVVTSLRRNLQRQYVERLIDLVTSGSGPAATKPISQLAISQLKKLKKQIESTLTGWNGKLDPYSTAHLEDAQTRIAKVLDSQYIFNAKDIGGGGGGMTFFFNTPPATQAAPQYHSQLQSPCNAPGCPCCYPPGGGWQKKKLSD